MSEMLNRDSGIVIVESPAGLEGALRKFKKSTVHILAEWRRRSYALGPSARRRQKRERAAARPAKASPPTRPGPRPDDERPGLRKLLCLGLEFD